MGRLEGKTALITGAARGIGRALARRYLQEGAHVAIADINIELARETASECGGNAVAVPLDVSKQESIDAAVKEVLHQFGGIDILINNAAILEMAPIVEISRDSYDRQFAVNVAGTLFTMQAVAKHMIARGKGGKIINVASQAGRHGEPIGAVYHATKAAVISLTQSAGLDLIKHKINVNAIAPGMVDTDMWHAVDSAYAKYEGIAQGEKTRKVVAKVIPFGRLGKAEDLTGMAVFLATDDAEYVVAQTYNVDGGVWMG